MSNNLNLNGSVALVTGAAHGLGLGMSEALVKRGAYVSLIDIDEEAGNTAITNLEKKYNASGRALFLKCDVTNKDEFEGAFKKIIEKFGKLHIVVNNAAIMTKYLDAWEKAININFKSVVHSTLLSFKYIENTNNKNIAVINISSISALSSTILPVYQATKRAIIEFTRSIGCEYNTRMNNNNIRVMAICPGPTFNIDEDNEDIDMIVEKLKVYITRGETNPNPDRKIVIQSTDYIQNALLHVLANGKSGEVWIAENKDLPRLACLPAVQY
ncbi:15-hydroxyprostaglandin dehydrogenase [NAD(+)]-like [Adelges cooleyi]|uniref:15-hydroxyprostaglandin dehydrogenase [NAD(+)]-like n=1 Tax=Adelges cooleyi TaxID=133065 RepID=UPI0021806113|nr:15-hydroxyprostaglandin dehydrogenase [NAD(+)]-like [Adelges cooleyi]